MGDVQSAQRGSRQDAAAEEESREVDNPQTEQNIKHETFKNSEQSSDISRKGDEVKMNGCHEDENGAQEAAPETQVDEEESQGEVDANDGVHLQITELDVKQNDINSFGRFFRNIGLKLTINRGSGEKVGDDNKETTTEEFEETKTEKTEDKTEGEAEQDSSDSTGPILTAVASENVLENADKSAETTEEPELKAESEQEPDSTNPPGPEDMEIDSPIRRFFARGIFAGLWKKKEEGDETIEKELEEMGENQVTETAGQTAQEQRDEEPTAPSELRDEIPGKSPEPDMLDSQDRDRVQMSPLLRFLSGSNLKRLSMKQRNIKSSDARLCDSGEHPAELLPSEPAEDHRNTSAPTSAEAAKEEEGAWASFKRFMSPKPRMKKSYHGAEETQQAASVEEPKAEQTSDHSSEEGNKRKNSSVSWEAVLCGSGRRRSRKTSDSEDEMPPIDLKYHKQDGKPKSAEESGAENEKETTSPKLDRSPQEDDGGSTWKSLKRIVTPKRKSRDEDEAIKIKIQSDGEGGQENSSFSIKNLLPGRKKQRSEERQGRVSSDEAGKDLASDEEDFETPGVVPLSEFEVDEEENKSLEEKEKLELQQDQGVDVNLCFPQDFDEDSEKQDTNEGLDDVTELASKHQQLSDIPEEGVIMEPWATLASLTEEAEGRGDTMVEDLREVTSEAITAPEPAADLTLQDETEMFTAASQFSSESATTSGNATPVPAERHIVETDTVLHQVAETFSTSPQTTTLEPEQTSEGCVKKESTILEMHRRLDATSTETKLNVEDLEALGGLVSASLREGISEVAEFKSGGFVSEGAFEEFDSTGHTEVEDEERPSAEEEDVQDLAKEQAEDLASEGGNETGEKESREAGDETLPLTEANVGAEDAKQVQEPEIESPVEGHGPSLEPKVIYDSFSMCLGAETGGGKPELETCLLTDVILEQLDAKSIDEPEDLQAEQASSLNRQEDITSSHEPPMISENPTTAETAKDEADETQILTETVEPAEAPQEPEVLCAVRELSSNVGEVSILFLETEVASSETPKEINVSDDIVKLQELKDCTGLTEDSHQLVEASTTVEEPEVSQAASSLASDKGNTASVETEQKADNIPKEEEIDVRENKKESIVTKATLESEEASTISEEPEVMKTVWPPALGSEEDNGLAPETRIILKVDLDTDEDKIQPKLLTEDTSEPLDVGKNVCMTVHPIPEESEHPSMVKEAACDHVSEEEPVPDEPKQKTTLSDTKLQSVDPSETVQEAEVSQVLKQSLESEETKQEPPDDISGEETVPDEPGDETTVAGETIIEPVDDSKTVEVAEELETVETSSLVREESSISPYEPEETPENTESDKDENKVETTLCTVYLNESEDAARVLNESEELKTVLQAECQTLAKEETAADEPEDETRVATESLFEKVDDYKPLQMSSFESEESSIPSSGPEASSENVLKAELETDQHKTQTTSITDDTSEPPDDPQNVEETQLSPTVQPSSEEPEKIPVSTLEAEETSENTPKAETVPDKTDKEKTPDPEDHGTVEELESEHPSMVKEVTSDHASEEPVPDEPKKETILSDTNPQSVDPSETVEEAEVSHVLKQSLESEECKEEPSENISEEETVPCEPRDEITIADETSSEPVDESKTVQIQEEPIQSVQKSSLVSQERRRSTLTAEETSENIPKVETVLVMVEASEAKPAEEPELSQTVQVSSLESEDDSIHSAEPEITSQIILIEETLPDEPGDETTVAGETIIEPVDVSKTAEEVEELETVETSSLVRGESSISPYEPEETPENTESDKDENKAETTLYTEYLNESEDAARVLNESEELKTVLQAECQTLAKEETAADEPEDVTRVATESLFEKVDDYKPLQMSSFESEESSIPSSGPEASSENVLKAELETDQLKTQTTSITDDTSEPPDDPQNVEEAQLSPTVQPSSEEPEKIPVSTLEAEETSENTPKAETVPDKTNKELMLDPEDLETVEKLESEHPSMVKEVTCDHASEEPVPDEPKQETILSDTNPQSVDPSETVEEAEVSQVLKQSLESEECKEEPSENISEEETVPFAPGDEITVAGETSSEPVDESKTVQIREEPIQSVQTSSLVSQERSRSTLTAEETSENIPKVETVLVMVEASEAKPAEEPELSQTVQLSSGQSEDNSIHSAEPETTSQIILTEETLPDEPKELKLHSEITLEPEEPSETDGEAEVLKDVHPQSLESEESRGQSPEGEVTSDNISEETTDKPRDETTVTGETSTEPVDESKTVEVVEELETVQTSSLVSQESSRSTLTAEETSENIPKVKLDAVENKVETVLVMVEASEAKPAEEPELSQTVQMSSLESEDDSIHSAEPDITSQIILTEETLPDEPGDETTVAGETIIEPVDDSKTAEVVEELETVETSSLVREESSISPYEPEETPENILKAGSDVDENKVETRLVTEEQPEFSQTVQSSALESEDNTVPSAEPEITSEIVLTEETAPDEPGDKTAAVGEAICGQGVKELQTKQQEENKSSSPPPEAEETSDISKAETVSGETKEEITLDPEDTESADQSEALTAVNPTPESEHPSLAKEATCAHTSGEEMVPDEHKEGTINEILDASTPVQELELVQDVIIPSLDSGELEVKSNNVAEAGTDMVLLSEVRFKPVDIQEPEVLKTVQAASFESVEASDETRVTPENIPKAEPAPKEEDLTVETTTDDLKTEQVRDDKCSGTETETVEDEDPTAPHMDKCHPKDVSEAVPDMLREQTSEALMDTTQAEEGVKEQVEAATPSVRDGVAEEVEEGKAEDTVEVAVVDAGTTSEGTTVDSVLEVEEMEVKDVMDVCCGVVHAVGSLSANKELEKEQILKEDKATTQEEKVQVDDEVEEKESTTVLATEASHSPPVTKAKEVNQDERADAEENIDIQEETAGSFNEAEEPLESQRGGEHVEQAGLEREVETAHASKIEEEGSKETNKADEACQFESKEEDCDVALEHPGNTSTAAVSLTG